MKLKDPEYYEMLTRAMRGALICEDKKGRIHAKECADRIDGMIAAADGSKKCRLCMHLTMGDDRCVLCKMKGRTSND